MLHLAHASRYHWSFVGTARNLAVGDWQISRVYAALNQSDLDLHFAKTSLEIVEKTTLLTCCLQPTRQWLEPLPVGESTSWQKSSSKERRKSSRQFHSMEKTNGS